MDMYPFAPNSISSRGKPHEKSILINIDLPRLNPQVLNSVTKLYILAYISLALSKNAYPERSRSIQWT
jgi:hypothetical protein